MIEAFIWAQGAPDVLGIGLGNGVFFQLKPSRGHVLERVLGCLSFCLLKVGPMFFLIDALRERLSRFNGLLSSLREGEHRVGAQSHIDSVLGDGLPVVEVPERRPVDSHSKLKAISIAEDIILVFRFYGLELTIREFGGLGAHEVCHRIKRYSKSHHRSAWNTR